MNNLKDIILIIALALISVVDSWASCYATNTVLQNYACQGGAIRPNYVSSSQVQCEQQISNHINCSADGFVSRACPVCYGTSLSNSYHEFSCCSNKREADSLRCVLDGKIWDVDPVSGVTSCVEEISCNWTVSTLPRLRCIDVPASGSIVCKDGECSGLPYSMWWSELRIDSMSTRCGQISHVHTSDTAYTFGSQCDVDERCSDEKKCYSEGGTFYIVQECAVGRPVVGNDGVSEKTVPYIVSTGKGSCSEMGYRNNNYQNSGGGVGNSNAIGGNPPPIDDECLVYGINCPEPDTTDYQQPPNQNPSKCYCEPYDGLGSMSKVTCPDGTVSIYYFSCLEWQHLFVSSSSNAPQSSASEPPTSSVGGTSSPSGGSSSDTFGQ